MGTQSLPKERAYGGGRLLGIPLILLVLLGTWKTHRFDKHRQQLDSI